MQIDTFFTMGKSHKVCEDYALYNVGTGSNKTLFAISDGCSSSKDSDFGSRILLKSLESSLPMIIPNELNGKDMVGEVLPSLIWNKAVAVANALGMPLGCLDATVNVGYTTEFNGDKAIGVITMGDGFSVAQRNNGNFMLTEVEFDKNAPYYLSYMFDPRRKKEFLLLDQKQIQKTIEFDKDGKVLDTEEFKMRPDFMFHHYYPLKEFKMVSVFSDGLKTFIPHDQTKPKLPLEQVVMELINFPVINGEFVKRRCMKFMKNHEESSFYDDFSMATFVRD